VADLIRGLMQRIPRGLLSFLDVKTGGTYPTLLGGILQPHIDLNPWYASEALQLTGVGDAAATQVAGGRLAITTTSVEDLVAGAGALIVPNTEIWLITQATATASIEAAGDVVDVSMCINANPTAVRFYVPPQVLVGNPDRAAQNWSARVLSVPPPGLLVAPGESIGFVIHQWTIAAAGTATPILRFKLMRFRA